MVIGVKIYENDGAVYITATGGETSLPFDFPIYSASHIKVILTRAGVDIPLALTTNYTVPAVSIGDEDGGSITLVSAALAGDKYALLLDVPYARTTDFNQSGDFFADTLNRELDLVAQQNQQIVRDIGKCAKLADTSTITSLELPAPVASTYLGWNSTATALQNYATLTGSTTVSSVMIPVVTASTLAAARSAMGVSDGVLNNYTATSVPGSGDDVSDGYAVGSRWVDTRFGIIYDCVDASLGAAIWQERVGLFLTQSMSNKTVNGVTLTAAGSANTFLNGAGAYTAAGTTDWVAYTPTFTGFGTVSGVAFYSRRNGKSLEIRGQFTSGTSTATEARISVGYNGTNSPVGLVADTAVITSTPRLVGYGALSVASASQTTILAESGFGYITIGQQSASRAGLAKINGDVVASSGTSIAIMADIPMQGW